MVGNLTHFKDHATLLRAWRLVMDGSAATETKPTLLLAGGLESETEPLRRLGWDLALGDSVRFLGFVEDVPGLLHAVDIGVFSSRSEGCPNGVLEPMAAGLPLVASDNEGVREALGDDRQTVPVGSPEATAKAILAMFGSPELRRELGQRNRARVEAEFSISAMCEQTAALITSRLGACD
jgi:glycosyltransferase involved in cell wall biosynthesis